MHEKAKKNGKEDLWKDGKAAAGQAGGRFLRRKEKGRAETRPLGANQMSGRLGGDFIEDFTDGAFVILGKKPPPAILNGGRE